MLHSFQVSYQLEAINFSILILQLDLGLTYLPLCIFLVAKVQMEPILPNTAKQYYKITFFQGDCRLYAGSHYDLPSDVHKQTHLL